MLNTQLLDYIKKQQLKSISDEVIKNALLNVGWKKEDVDETFTEIKKDVKPFDLQPHIQEKPEIKPPNSNILTSSINNASSNTDLTRPNSTESSHETISTHPITQPTPEKTPPITFNNSSSSNNSTVDQMKVNPINSSHLPQSFTPFDPTKTINQSQVIDNLKIYNNPTNTVKHPFSVKGFLRFLAIMLLILLILAIIILIGISYLNISLNLDSLKRLSFP